MKRINNTKDLTDHSEECFVKNNLDGSVCVLCFCGEAPKPTKKSEVKKLVDTITKLGK